MLPRTLFSLVVCAATLVQTASVARAAEQQWGDLTGTFVFAGEAPEQVETMIKGVVIRDETLVVDAKSGGLANVVLYLIPQEGKTQAVHGSYTDAAKAKVEWSIEDNRFSPHVISLRTKQLLQIENKDPHGHSPYIDSLKNPGYSTSYGSEKTRTFRYAISEDIPLKVICGIYPGMEGWVVLRNDPYIAISDTQGKFSLKYLPAGPATFRLWHEKQGFIREVTIAGKATPLVHGSLPRKINAGANDLGTIKVGSDVILKSRVSR